MTVTGKVLARRKGNVELNKQYSLNYLIRRDGGIKPTPEIPTPTFDMSGQVEASWFLDRNARSWLNTRDHYFVKLTPDGLFRVDGVPTGKYDLLIQLYEEPVGCLVETVGAQVVTVDVSDQNTKQGTVDAGTIEVACRTGPRAGESMRSYQFVDTTNRVRSINDLKGRYVVMHVWASWCPTCITSMNAMQRKLGEWKNSPVTFIGVNVDSDRAQGKEFAQRQGWKWSHNYVGDHADITRQLAISSVPTYFLIGPDGLLIGNANDWSLVQEQLETAVANGGAG